MISCRVLSSKYTHTFNERDVVMKIVSPVRVTHFNVVEVVSPHRIIVSPFTIGMSESNQRNRVVEGEELASLIKDDAATKLLKILIRKHMSEK